MKRSRRTVGKNAAEGANVERAEADVINDKTGGSMVSVENNNWEDTAAGAKRSRAWASKPRKRLEAGNLKTAACNVRIAD